MERQPEISAFIRSFVVDNFIKWHFVFDLRQETLFLTIYIFDKFLSAKTLNRKKLQLVCMTCLFIACKFEEVKIIRIQDFLKYCDESVTKANVLDLENEILGTLNFKLTFISPYDFLKRIFYINTADLDKCLLTRPSCLLPAWVFPLWVAVLGVHEFRESSRCFLSGCQTSETTLWQAQDEAVRWFWRSQSQ